MWDNVPHLVSRYPGYHLCPGVWSLGTCSGASGSTEGSPTGTWPALGAGWVTFIICVNSVGPDKEVDFAILNSLRNCLFLSVTLLLPSTLTLYLLNPGSSTTIPVLSHLLVILLTDHFSMPKCTLCFMACSLLTLSKIQHSWGRILVLCSFMGRKFCFGLPKISCAGDNFDSGSGVFLWFIKTLRTLP